MRVRRALPFFLVALLASRAAWAQPAADAGADPMAAAEAAFSDSLSAIDAADCGTACRALGSLLRAADQICALDPGPPCADARDRFQKAAARVHASCPDCPAAAMSGDATTPRSPSPEAQNAASPPPPAEAEYVATAPPHRGCASCAIADRPGDATIPLATLALLACVLRAKRRRRD